jgi:hypothetical protein
VLPICADKSREKRMATTIKALKKIDLVIMIEV